MSKTTLGLLCPTFAFKTQSSHNVSCWVSYDRSPFTQFTEQRKSTSSLGRMDSIQVTAPQPI